MSKRKVSFSLSGGESSKKGPEKRQKKEEEEFTSKKGHPHRVSSKVNKLLSGNKATERYNSDFVNRAIELGRVVDFSWLEKESELEIDVWLNVVGWKDFVSINEPVYPRLLRVLYANLNPLSMISCVGNIEVRLGVDAWCETFGIPNLDAKEESMMRNMPKEEIFQDLFGKDGLGVKNWVNINELPQDPTIRLAANILMNVLIPKKGSKEQIKEEEGRILYTLKHGRNLNLAREIVERIKQSTIRKSTPLCYGMHLMVLLKKAGVNLLCAGDKVPLQLRTSSHINAITLGRLGFKKDFNHWILVKKGRVTGRFSGETSPSARTRTEEESTRRTEEDIEGGAATAAESSAPDQPQPSSSTHYIPSPHLNRQLTNLQTTLSNQIAHLSSHMGEKIDFLTAIVSSRLENLDSKLNNLTNRVQHCETLLQPSQAQPSPPHTSTPQPPQPSHVQSPPQPAQASSSPIPTQPIPIPIPSSSPPSPQLKEPGNSPLFSMDELLQSQPILQPELPTDIQPPQPEPPTTTKPPQPDPPASASSQALQVVCSTLQIDKPKRYKQFATKRASKPSKHTSKDNPK